MITTGSTRGKCSALQPEQRTPIDSLVESKSEHEPHHRQRLPNHVDRERLRLQPVCCEISGGGPECEGNASSKDSTNHFEAAHQIANRLRGVPASAEARHLAVQRRRDAQVKKREPGLHECEHANQAQRLVAEILYVQRQKGQAHYGHPGLPKIVRRQVVFQRQSASG